MVHTIEIYKVCVSRCSHLHDYGWQSATILFLAPNICSTFYFSINSFSFHSFSFFVLFPMEKGSGDNMQEIGYRMNIGWNTHRLSHTGIQTLFHTQPTHHRSLIQHYTVMTTSTINSVSHHSYFSCHLGGRDQ